MARLRLPLALRILLHSPGRLAVSCAGILLAVVLMFSQAGFRNAMFDSQAELINRLDGDLVIVSKLKDLMYSPVAFPSARIAQARAVPGVASVAPLYIEMRRSVWKNPVTLGTRPIRVLAYNPDDKVFDFPGVSDYAEALKMPNTVLFDIKSRDYYGRPGVGTETELAGRPVVVVGTFRLGTDFMTDGNVIMSDRNFLKFFPDRVPLPPGLPPGVPFQPEPKLAKVDVGVVRLEPGADPQSVKKALSDALDDDVTVMTKQEMVDQENRYWRDNTSIGAIFTLGLVVGFIVGIIICYQILYTNVAAYLPQFATMKAIGYTDWFLIGVVLQQAVLLAVLGFIPGLGAAQVLFWIVAGLTGLLMFLTADRIAFILLLTVAMCMLSGAIAVRRVVTTDPAEVFR